MFNSFFRRPYATIITRSLVIEYVQVFEVGLSTAQDGFNFASRGLSYKDIDISKATSTERESYFADMRSFATQGKDKSERARAGMRALRQKLHGVS